MIQVRTGDAPGSGVLTLMAVHAHPDDEASHTGGILARYSAEGVRTVLVTCTNGELGDAPQGPTPADATHEPDKVAALRYQELKESCRILGVRHLHLLGYRDSGITGWASNEDPEAFCNTPLEEPVARLASLMERYRPQVVVTYDSYGFYGHPDHIQAHRVTLEALDRSGLAAKLYCPTVRRSLLLAFADVLGEAGADLTQLDLTRIGAEDEEVVASIDCQAWLKEKRAALEAHASQANNILFLNMPSDIFDLAMGTEEFIRLRDPINSPPTESDLFAGLR